MDKEDPGSHPSVTARHTLPGKCPANSALEGGVPAYRQARRGTILNDKSLPGSLALCLPAVDRRPELHSALFVVRVGFEKHEPQI